MQSLGEWPRVLQIFSIVVQMAIQATLPTCHPTNLLPFPPFLTTELWAECCSPLGFTFGGVPEVPCPQQAHDEAEPSR